MAISQFIDPCAYSGFRIWFRKSTSASNLWLWAPSKTRSSRKWRLPPLWKLWGMGVMGQLLAQHRAPADKVHPAHWHLQIGMVSSQWISGKFSHWLEYPSPISSPTTRYSSKRKLFMFVFHSSQLDLGFQIHSPPFHRKSRIQFVLYVYVQGTKVFEFKRSDTSCI